MNVNYKIKKDFKSLFKNGVSEKPSFQEKTRFLYSGDVGPRLFNNSASKAWRASKLMRLWRFILRCLTTICLFTAISTGVARAQITETVVTTDTAGVISYTIPLSPTIATVDSAGLNIRKGPGREYDWRATLLQNEQVTILGTNARECLWVYAQTPPNKYDGWINAKYLRNESGNLIHEDCPVSVEAQQSEPEAQSQPRAQDKSERENGPFTEPSIPYQILLIGFLALLVAGLLYWLASARGLFSRTKNTLAQSHSHIPKVGTPYLEYVSASAQTDYYSLDGKEMSIGRGTGNMLVIDEGFSKAEGVSLQHARIERDGDRLVIVDLDSKNGTFVDGRRTQENVLYDGMRVRLGEVEFTFRMNTR